MPDAAQKRGDAFFCGTRGERHCDERPPAGNCRPGAACSATWRVGAEANGRCGRLR
jgi:hypothetical protein